MPRGLVLVSSLVQDAAPVGSWARINPNKAKSIILVTWKLLHPEDELFQVLKVDTFRVFFPKEGRLNSISIFVKSTREKGIGAYKTVVVSGAC